MIDDLKYIECNGEKYPIAFSMNVWVDIQKTYGTLDAWTDLVSREGKEPDFEALRYGLYLAMNEGIDIENEKIGGSRPYLTEKQVGRLITDIATIARQMQNIVIEQAGVDTQKNITTGQSQNQ